MSFQDLETLTGRTLSVRALNITTQTIETLSTSTHPDLDVVTAVQASCAIPMLFAPVRIGQYDYLDVAILENAAVHEVYGETTLAMVIKNDSISLLQQKNQRLLDFIQRLVSTITHVHTSMQLKGLTPAQRSNVVLFGVQIESRRWPASMYPSEVDLKRLINNGAQIMEQYIASNDAATDDS